MENQMLMILLIVYTASVCLMGLKFRKNQNSEEYFLASRRLPSWLLSITFVASWWGGGSAIDLVDMANRDGISTYWIYGVPVLLSTALMYLLADKIRAVGTLSQPELMERRYDSRSAFMLTIFILIFMVVGSAVQVIVIGSFFESFFGMSYSTGAILGTSMVIIYSMFGGFKGVVMTDLAQFCLFLIAALLLFVVAYNRADGFGGMLTAIEEGGSREGFTSIFHNISDNIAYVITFGTSWMVQANVWQRISAAKTPRSAKRMMGISFLLFIPLYMVVTLTGMLSIVSYDVVPAGGIVAAMIQSLDSPIIVGLLFLGLCSAIMSTMDSMFNTGAMSLTIDIYKRYICPDGEPQRYVNVGRLSTLLVALLSLFIGLNIRSVITVSWIGADFIASGAFVPLVAAFVWRRGNSRAAFASMIFGLLFSSYHFVAALWTTLPTAWEVASVTHSIVGILISTLIYISVSLLAPDKRFLDRL
ncbi:MAG: sodium:solute symporter family protein [Rikenellaceae bacterium]